MLEKLEQPNPERKKYQHIRLAFVASPAIEDRQLTDFKKSFTLMFSPAHSAMKSQLVQAGFEQSSMELPNDAVQRDNILEKYEQLSRDTDTFTIVVACLSGNYEEDKDIMASIEEQVKGQYDKDGHPAGNTVTVPVYFSKPEMETLGYFKELKMNNEYDSDADRGNEVVLSLKHTINEIFGTNLKTG